MVQPQAHFFVDRCSQANRVPLVASFDDVATLALVLPQAREQPLHGWRSWRVADKLFVWERPLLGSDLRALGDAAPQGPILGARTDGFGEKEALLQSDPGVFFTTPHFDRSPTVLVRLSEIGLDELAVVIVDAWLARAPKKLADAYLAAAGRDGQL
jgi:hypothetical protein